ncbi:ditrans,polycis-undecaprenyl-diphosphate synthase [bacterium BMS3Abin01]|nr:ditrans,polycis-undecaprenyl-diphosphate synthase [bacterium BMS3Abin01]
MRLLSLPGNLRRKKKEREDFLLEGGEAPAYVAIIMDGNGRWAAERHLPAIAGHREGARTLKKMVRAARQAGVLELTVYAFSTENWRRPREEIDDLMKMFGELIERETPELNQEGVRMRFIGRRQGLSDILRRQIDESERLTGGNQAMTLFVAFNYGGRAEIVDAFRAAADSGFSVKEEEFHRYLYAPEMHDPELLIRTSGEQRLSNFLLWQCAYSELYFSHKLWPAFEEHDLLKAFNEFNRRRRRFGAR